MKHILILTPTYDPSKDGVAEAAKVTARGLASRGFRVTVATGYLPDRGAQAADANPVVKQFRVGGTSNLRAGIHGDVAAYQEFIANFPGDFILCHSWEAWTTDLAAPVFSKTPAKKVLASHGFSVHLVH